MLKLYHTIQVDTWWNSNG